MSTAIGMKTKKHDAGDDASGRAGWVAGIDSIRDRHRLAGPTRKSRGIYGAAVALVPVLETGKRIDRHALREALEASFGGSDAGGCWSWKDAYEAAEAATVLFIGRYARALKLYERSIADGIRRVERIAACEPPQTRRSEEQVALQQFSTPLAMAYAAARAAEVRPDDIVLEPSAGTGMLASMALPVIDPTADGRLVLNELAADRAGLLTLVFDRIPVTRHDAEAIRDRLPEAAPTVVLMNPPFSRTPGIERARQNADLLHIWAAYRALLPGGRLVAITSESCHPGQAQWQRMFARLNDPPQALFTIRLDGRLYQSRGTTIPTRMTVLERPNEANTADGPTTLTDAGTAKTGEELAQAIARHVRPRVEPTPREAVARARVLPRQQRAGGARGGDADAPAHDWGECGPLTYETLPPRAEHETAGEESPYQRWEPSLRIEGATPHPTQLVESTAMGAVEHRRPSTRPVLPKAILEDKRLSEAQLESVVLAAEALGEQLPGFYVISDDHEKVRWLGETDDGQPPPRTEVQPSDDGDYGTSYGRPVAMRQGWMLGDGTGAGKGRQVAAVILDQWLQGRQRALWLSQSDKLIEDARRDWRALGGADADIIQLTKIKQQNRITQSRGILFCTYATLRSPGRKGNLPRIEQIIEWLAGWRTEEARHAYDGVVVFDEAHAMQNAAGGKGSRGKIPPSQQGLAGLRLQHALPNARIVYVSATGASTIEGLAYAERLGLWMSNRTPFNKREDFVNAMDKGGVAALEVVARDLKAFGLYQARALSYDGVEIDIVVHDISSEQREIYDSYAGAFQIIHEHIDEALEAANVTIEGETKNAMAKAAARSAFESCKQRFFGHLLTSMKVPTLIRCIEEDLKNDRSAVVQLVSTGEALTERRLAEIPVAEWDDLSIDLTPREYMLDYLRYAFPTTLHKTVTNSNGDEESIPVMDETGKPVKCQEAEQMRDRLIEELGILPPVGSALDQLLHHFGQKEVAEITGRSRRVVRVKDERGERNVVRTRAGSANLHETQEFMAGRKRILIFSGAGNTGRSYHADMSCGNTKRRHHYLLEAGWRADQAIQGLGRTHRTHQREAPVFRPVTTNVKGERRFISTIARRLDSLGAITRGQRDSQTSMGADRALFRAADNFESPYARAALRQFYLALYHDQIKSWSIGDFASLTGLRLLSKQGELLENLPPMPIFLNRLVALPIRQQNELFAELETRIEANIQEAIDKGTFAQGVEVIRADHLRVSNHEVACTHPGCDADTEIVEVMREDRIRPLTAAEALGIRDQAHAMKQAARLMINLQSKRAALAVAAPVRVLDNGGIERRVRLLRPTDRESMSEKELSGSKWREATPDRWRERWERERAQTDEFLKSRFWLVTGVLLPVWHRLAGTDLKVYRLTTDEGQSLIGRALTASEITLFREQLGLDAANTPQLNSNEVFDETLQKRGSFRLAVGWRIAARQHMGRTRVELEGPKATNLGMLKRLGCRTEMVSYRTRIFIPNATTLQRLLEQYPLAATN